MRKKAGIVIAAGICGVLCGILAVVHDNEVMETYPEQMNVYMYCRIGEGGSSTFVEEALKALKDLGWDVEEIE